MSDIRPMVDANILVYAHNRDSPFYHQASSLLTKLVTTNGFCISSLVLHEFFSVITDGRKIERPLVPESALSIIVDYTRSHAVELLSADESNFFFWLQNTKHFVKRYEIYDAFIAYSMHQNGISHLITRNSKDFKIFGFIQAINPFDDIPLTRNEALRSHGPTPIPYARQSISEQDVASVCSVLRSDFLTQGPKVPEFEQAVAEYCKADHAVAVNSGTSALHLACLALGLGPGDTLWTSPITFVASANCALYCGANVDFVDIDPRTYNFCPLTLEKKLQAAQQTGKLPKVVVPVHFSGQPCDMQAIHELGRQYGFRILEDASHALGARYKNEPVGNCRYSDITVFSFHPVKSITTGEGGMALTNDPALAQRMTLLRSHGISRDPACFVPSRYPASDVRCPISDNRPPSYYYELNFRSYCLSINRL